MRLPPGQAGRQRALTDTPVSTAPNTAPSSPKIHPFASGTSTPRSRPTTLDIPGLTSSKASPDGRIAQRDVGAKLVIVMVGLPARGKSYVTKKLARYLNWLQHDTKIFNVGERRRVAAGSTVLSNESSPRTSSENLKNDGIASIGSVLGQEIDVLPSRLAAQILLNGEPLKSPKTFTSAHSKESLSKHVDLILGPPAVDIQDPIQDHVENKDAHQDEGMDQSADFFDPNNIRAAQLREQVAMSTLDELLDYVLDQGGAVGILDATNSTLERRKMIVEKVRARAGNELGILFLESACYDNNLLESNMRLKLSGPDYKDQDPAIALDDFKKRVAIYEKNYVPLGKYEEDHDMAFVQMIDVGRKVVSHQVRGFLAAQTVYYLLNFNLSPRQIWITRHGESKDNVSGKIGGDSGVSEEGRKYAKALAKFMSEERKAWDVRQRDKALSTHFPPQPGDTTPPNPEIKRDFNTEKNFCVWTSMLKRSIQTVEYFDEEEFDIKQMKMLDELNAGVMEGMTYEEIRVKYSDEYAVRKKDKLHYRYPGAGGESYLDIINRLRPVIVEVERTTDHVLLVCHRSVARILLAYFKGLNREDVADLEVPLGMLYMLEPKPYGVDFKAYQYNGKEDRFEYLPEYQLKATDAHGI
ncbi:MAG: hypothetical protein M1829_003600 [Trizodia sp. TS-e1964]|nr:MAG: hypothetical protein M1829_003600 [Trizodia sp. TS-e1964]